MKARNRLSLLTIILTAPILAACQTTGSTSETGRPNEPQPAAATAPIFVVGDSYRIAVTKSKSGTRDYVRTFDGIRNGLLVFLDDKGAEYAFYAPNLSAVRVGETQYISNSGMLHFPMQVGTTWRHQYTHKTPTETRDRERRCTVKDWEPVEVMAGRLMAFRIQCTNQWSQASTPADELYWYAPAVKFVVKYESTEWYYATELKSYELKNKTAAGTPRYASSATDR